MKKFTKVCMSLSLIFLLIGLALCIVGFAGGYGPKEFVSDARLGRFSVGPAVMTATSVQNGDDYEGEEGTVTFADVTAIDLEMDMGQVTVCGYDGDEVSVEVKKPTDRYECSQKKGEIKIRDTDHPANYFLTHPAPEVYIYLPRNTELDSVSMEIGMGSISADDVSCRKLELENGMGDVNFSGSVGREAKVECGMGSVKMTLPGSEQDYNYEFDCGIGKVTIGDKTYSGFGNDGKVKNQAKVDLELENGMGDITVDFS